MVVAAVVVLGLAPEPLCYFPCGTPSEISCSAPCPRNEYRISALLKASPQEANLVSVVVERPGLLQEEASSSGCPNAIKSSMCLSTITENSAKATLRYLGAKSLPKSSTYLKQPRTQSTLLTSSPVHLMTQIVPRAP